MRLNGVTGRSPHSMGEAPPASVAMTTGAKGVPRHMGSPGEGAACSSAELLPPTMPAVEAGAGVVAASCSDDEARGAAAVIRGRRL